MNKIVKRVLLLISGLVVVGAASAVLLVYIAIEPTIEEIPFEKSSWKTGTNRAQMQFPRQRMVRKLIKTNILLGKSEKEIHVMLGKPDSTFNEKSILKTYNYFIGLVSSEDEWLEIYFNSKNIVVKNELVVH